MPNEISQQTQIDASFKASQSVAFTDLDKSNFEENNSFNHLIDANDVFVDEIAYNDPQTAINAFVVSSGLIQFTDDITSGDEYRTYYLSGITNIVHPKKYGNNYSPVFYDGSMNTIYDGDFYKYSTVDWKNAYITIERNAVTDLWTDPIYFDGFWYTGQTLADITIGGGGSNSGVVVRDEGTLVNANASTLNFVGTNVTATSTGPASVNITVGGVTSAELASSGNVLWNRDVVLTNNLNSSGQILLNLINGISASSGGITNAQLVQTSGDIVNQIPTVRTGVVLGDTFSGTPLSYTVYLNPPMPDNNYTITISANINRTFTFDAYSSGQFTIYSSSNSAMNSSKQIHWQLIKY